MSKRKKLFSILLCICLLLSSFSFSVWGVEESDFSPSSIPTIELLKTKFRDKNSDISKSLIKSENVFVDKVGASGTSGDITWNLSSSGELTISGSGYMEDFDYLSGTFAPWIEYYSSITSIVINSGVTSIGDEAFIICEKVTSISIPNTVEYIGISAFEGCSSLTKITIPESVYIIGDFAFSGSGLNSLNIPSSVWYIGMGITSYCESLQTITVDSENEYYKSASNCIIDTETDYIIAACEGSSIPDGDVYFNTYSIDSYAFQGITSLESIHIPDYIINVFEGAFIDCPNVTSITVDETSEYYYAVNNTLIQKNNSAVVLGCGNSDMPDDGSILEIKAFAFYNCDLSYGLIPKSVTEIGMAAFYGCSNLKHIYLGDNITKIGAYAFDETGYYNTSGSNWENSVMYIGKYAVAISSGFSKEFCNLREGTEIMADDLFAGQTQLKNAKFPDSMKSVSEGAFTGCISLETLNLPPLLETIGEFSFAACTSLTTFTMPEFLENIEEGAFAFCTSLSEIVIPKSVKTIGDYAFAYCPALNKVTVKSYNVQIGEQALGYNIDEETGDASKNESLVIYCESSSTAARYALYNGFTTEMLPAEVKDPFYINVKYNTMPNISEKTTTQSFNYDLAMNKYIVIASFVSGGEKLIGTDYIPTGCVMTTTGGDVYIAVVNGDVDGSGTVDSTDYLQVKKTFLNDITLEGVFLTAADTNQDGLVDSTDYLQIKNYFLGKFDLYK